MKSLITCFLLSATFVLCKAEEATYHPADGGLFLPSVVADEKVYANAYMQKNAGGSFDLRFVRTLTAAENTLYHKLQKAGCRPADVFNKLAAYKAFVDGNVTLCLLRSSLITTEGGVIRDYLLIENGTIQLVTDNRGDGYGVCCFGVSAGYNKLEYGYLDKGSFVPQSLADPLNFERDYVLRVAGPAVQTLQF